MTEIMVAGSPVEIEAKADAAGLGQDVREAALGEFHALTSRLELNLLQGDADGGEPWPRHRFYFGPAPEIAAMVARLHGMDGVAEAPDTAPIVFVASSAGAFGALLVAGSDPGWVNRAELC
jgi:hypothetical protein